MMIAMRADASPAMGIGHVKRCLALAVALREAGTKCVLLTRDLGVDVAALAREQDVRCTVLPRPKVPDIVEDYVPHAGWAGVSWEQDVSDFFTALAGSRPDWVVVDHYAFDARWHSAVHRALHARVCVIDDLADRDLDAHVLVDQNLCVDHAEKYAGRLRRGTRLLGGPRYALLGPRYKDVRPIPIRPQVRSVGIFLGGTDPAELSRVALGACRDHARFEGPIEMVTTSANPRADELATLALKYPHTRLTVDAADLSEFFGSHDLQIGAGGGAAWERCCFGVPTIALTAADNQLAVLPELAARSAAIVLDEVDSRSEHKLATAVMALLNDVGARTRLARSSRDLVDGLGAVRVALILCRESVQVRPASLDDSTQMHIWRNHPAVRNVSRNSAELSLSDHERWLSATLGNKDRCLLIAHLGEIGIGVVRFDRSDENAAEVSIYLNPDLQGLGLGSFVLTAAENFVVEHRWPLRELVAEILEENHASQRLFSACGYQPSQRIWRKHVHRKEQET